jgi:hypothetical protein
VAPLALQPEHLSLVAKYFGDAALKDLEATMLHRQPPPPHRAQEAEPPVEEVTMPLRASPIRLRPPADAAPLLLQPALTLRGSGSGGGGSTPGRVRTPGRATPSRTPLRTPGGLGGSVDALLDWANTLDFDFDDL